MHYEFTSKVVLWEHNPKFFLAIVPTKYFDELKEMSDAFRRGWGAVRVEVTIGKTTWQTSMFPNSKRTFDIPLKAAVRKAEGIVEGTTVRVRLELVDF